MTKSVVETIEEDFCNTFQNIGKENKQIKVIGLLYKSSSHSPNPDPEYIIVSVCTDHVDYQCYDWRLERKIRRGPRLHELEKKSGIPIIVNVISSIEEIPKEGDTLKKSDVIKYLYGKPPLYSSFKFLYIEENFLPSSPRS